MAMHTSDSPKSLWHILPEALRESVHRPVTVSGLTLDSRAVEKGYAFIAVKGSEADGRCFIPQALTSGCSVVIAEANGFGEAFPDDGTVARALRQTGTPLVLIHGLQEQVSQLAAAFYDYPAASMSVVGVTGTNGKTTTVSLISQLLSLVGIRAATLGTLGYGLVTGEQVETGMTTPDAIRLQEILAELKALGAHSLAMEVSSHSLDQHRVDAANITTAVYTNLSRDHLDYHGDEASYAAAKSRLFSLETVNTVVINSDDSFGMQLLDALPAGKTVYSYGLTKEATVHTENIRLNDDGVATRVNTPWGSADVVSPLLGEFNLYNLLAAITVVCAGGADFGKVIASIPSLVPVSGRMEVIDNGCAPKVIVDYAHTPDALEKALLTLRSHCTGKLWCVFGCGGDRDSGKRSGMGAVARHLADYLVITSDNPRREDPEAIMADIVSGIENQDGVRLEVDRQKAIAMAIELAASEDFILIAGKGHETYQQVGQTKRPFSDQQQARNALANRQATGGTCS